MANERHPYYRLVDAWVKADDAQRAEAMNVAQVGIDRVKDETEDSFLRRQFGLAARTGRLDRLWDYLATKGALDGDPAEWVNLGLVHAAANADLDQSELKQRQEAEHAEHSAGPAEPDNENGNRDTGAPS